MNSRNKDAPARRSPLAIYAGVALAAALAGFVAVYVNYGVSGNGGQGAAFSPPAGETPAREGQAERAGLARFAKGEMATFVARDEPQPLPDFSFNDGEGKPRTIADWKGRVVLLNLWATWCGPCREEMPSLDRLQAELGGEGFEVVAVSIDKSEGDKPLRFLKEIGIRHLNFYHDPTARFGTTLKAYGLPTTLLIDQEGREAGRLVGPAEWDSDDALALIRAAIGEAAAKPPPQG